MKIAGISGKIALDRPSLICYNLTMLSQAAGRNPTTNPTSGASSNLAWESREMVRPFFMGQE